MKDLLSSYTPYWLYIGEFMDALPGDNLSDKKEAVLLLIRDRLIVDGTIDERHFRFLAGKPDIEDAQWLANLSDEDVVWGDSSIRAASEKTVLAGQQQWFLIEIATSALTLFRAEKSGTSPKAKRIAPEQKRALDAILEIYGEIPPQSRVPTPDLDKTVNDRLKLKKLKPVHVEAIRRASGRRRG